MSEERRATYRVSVRPSASVSASLSLADRKWQARPGNISTEGMFVRLEPDAPVSLDRHTPVVIEISFGSETPVKLHGTIRSHRGGGYGIFFPKRTDTGYVNPLDALGRIWAELQRDDLSKRLFLGKDWLASYESEK